MFRKSQLSGKSACQCEGKRRGSSPTAAPPYRISLERAQAVPASSSILAKYNCVRYVRSRVLPLQTMDRERRRARLLDDHGNGSHSRPFGWSARGMGEVARNCWFLRRSTNLCLAQIDHVLAKVLLLLRASEEKFSGALRFSLSHAEGSSSATQRPSIEVQGVSHHSHQAPRWSRGPNYWLASGSLRTVRSAGVQGEHGSRQIETQAEV